MHNRAFYIGRRRGDGGWEQLGRAEGPNPEAAFRRWVGDDPSFGEYGVRRTDELEWSLFVLDDRGVYPVGAPSRFSREPAAGLWRVASGSDS